MAGIIGGMTNNNIGVAGIAGGWYDTDPARSRKGVRILPAKCWPDFLEISNAIFLTPDPIILCTSVYEQVYPATAKAIIECADKGADIIQVLIGGLEGIQGNRNYMPSFISELYLGYYSIRGQTVKLYLYTIREAIDYAHSKGGLYD